MKLLVTGSNGLLATALKGIIPEATFVTHREFDLTRPLLMRQVLTEVKPDVLINTSAYNAVEHCETDYGGSLSWWINGLGPESLAMICADLGIKVVHFSTDYVFDGEKGTPYTEYDIPKPLNAYGRGKLHGEKSVLAYPRNLVLRTSWMFGQCPSNRTYVHSVMRQLVGDEPIKAAMDQISIPTYSKHLARWTMELIKKDASGRFHAVSNNGCSRYEWTNEILLWAGSKKKVVPVSTESFGSKMKRPKFSVMSNDKMRGVIGDVEDWISGLEEMLEG